MSMESHLEERPFFLRGNYAPVKEEVTAFDLPTQGSIPPEIRGRFLRNGPNPPTGESPHWFFGAGMIHGVHLENGTARWYRNRYVRTKLFEDENATWMHEDGSIDLTVATANTHVISHAGRILALVENSFPTELGPELDTIGVYDFDGRLRTAMTAHPKICPVTGEMHFFGYGFAPPFLTYHRTDASGQLVQSQVIEVPGPTMIHDFAITEQHVIFMDLPVVFDVELAMQGTMPYRWSDDYGARLGIMPRGVSDATVRWLEVDPCYVFHPLNAFDDGERVVIDVARYPELWRGGPDQFTPASLHRWTVDLEAGKVLEAALDDRAIEFPRMDPRRTGLSHRYGYAVCTDGDLTEMSSTLIKYDLRSGASEVHDFGAGHGPSEAVFVPAGDGAAEDEGWLLTYVYDAARNGSDLVILDATRLSAPPVARIELPQRVPYGFHGSWIPDAA